jgi:WD40 repeat protein
MRYLPILFMIFSVTYAQQTPVSLELVHQIEADTYGIWWSPGGTYFATASKDMTDCCQNVQVWQHNDWLLINSVESNPTNHSPIEILWSPDESHLAIIPDGGDVILAETEGQRVSIISTGRNILDADWSNINILSLLVQTGMGVSSLRHYDVSSPDNPQLIHTSDDLEPIEHSIFWNPDGTQFATISNDGPGYITIWGDDFEPVRRIMVDEHFPVYNALQWSKDGEVIYVLVATHANGGRLWQWYVDEEPQPPQTDFVSLHIIRDFQLSYDEQYFLVVDYHLTIGDVETGDSLLTNVSQGGWTHAAWHPSANIIAVNDGQTISFYEVR